MTADGEAERDRLLAATRRRLLRTRAGDSSAVWEGSADAEIEGLHELLAGERPDAEAGYRLGWLLLLRHSGRPPSEAVLVTIQEAFAGCLLAGVGDIPAALLPSVASVAESSAVDLLKRAVASPAPASVDTAVNQSRRILAATPADHPGRPQRLANLCVGLQTRYEHRASRADLDEAIEVGRQAWETTSPEDSARDARLYSLAGALRFRYRHVGGAAVFGAAVARMKEGSDAPADAFTIGFLAGGDDIPATVASDVAAEAAALTVELQRRLIVAPDHGEHELIIDLWRRILHITPPGDARHHVYLANLSQALLLRHQLTGSSVDLEAALDTARRSTESAPADDPRRALGLVNLGCALAERYRIEGAPDDLDLAIELVQEATGYRDDANRARYLCELGGLWGLRFGRYQVPADLDAAIAALRASTEAAPADPQGPGFALNSLGEALEERFRFTGAPEDLDDAVGTLRAAVEATGKGHWASAQSRGALGSVLKVRFQQRGHRPDLEEGIGLLREAVAMSSEGSQQRALSLGNLTSALYVRLHVSGVRQEDIDETVALARENLECLPTGHIHEGGSRAILAHALQMRFEQRGHPDDLAETVALGKELLSGGPERDPTMLSDQLNAGAAALVAQYLDRAPQADLHAAVDALRAALGKLPPGHVSRPIVLHNLALALASRAAHNSDGTDIDAAVDAQRSAIREPGLAHHARPMLLSALGGFLQTRAVRRGTPVDVDEAIDVLATAEETYGAGHPQRHLVHPTWCQALLLRYETTGSRDDLEAAVAVAREGVCVTPAFSPRRPWLLGRLGHGLLQQHRHRSGEGDPDDSREQSGELEEAIAVLREAYGDGSREGTFQATLTLLLAAALQARHQRDGAHADLAEAVALAERTASSVWAPPLSRAMAAVEAGGMVAETEPSRAADFYESAVRLLPHVAPRQLRRDDQQHLLTRFAGLVSHAAARALDECGRPPAERAVRALRLLEAGRGVLMGQALDTWSDLTALRREHPELAACFEELRDRLDRPDAETDPLLGGPPLLGAAPLAGGAPVAADRHRLAAELDAVLTRIRAQDGFGSFALPPALEELLEVVEEGAVVLLNVTAARGDALLVTRRGVTTVELPGLALETAMRMALDCQTAAHEATAGTHEVRIESQQRLVEILARLWDVVAEPVLAAMGHDRVPDTGRHPRVWWSPGGPLAWLPIHAAGHHDGSDRSVLDRVVSSYTPTLRALRHAHRPLPEGAAPGRPVVVAMPETPGHPPLDFAAEEVEVFEEHMGGAVALIGPRRPPTRDEVLHLLPGSPVAHFACHGDSMGSDPSQHRLLLHDHAEGPFTVAELASVRLDHARLAYLSACATAVSYDGQLFDEAIHLTSAFQLCGFRHVVGTLWPVVDDTAVAFADAFYAALRPASGAVLDPARSPYALHTAVRALRAVTPRSPSLWASHIHTGA